MTGAHSHPWGSLAPRLQALRPRWAWILLGLGLPWLLTPLSCRSGQPGGCLAMLLGTCFWVAFLVLAPLGLRWLWRRLLFKVSRRLWMILLLTTLLPAITLTAFFLALAWLGLGAQMSRAVQATQAQHLSALREAAKAPTDREAILALDVIGQAQVDHVRELPPGLKPGFLGLVLLSGQELALRSAEPQGNGHRLVTLPLRTVRQADFWGGCSRLRLDWSRNGAREKTASLRTSGGPSKGFEVDGSAEFSGEAPVRAWTEGVPAAGKGLLKPFSLPPVTLRVVDWESGRPMSLSVTPETSLKDLLLGYGFGKGNLSAKALIAIILILFLMVFMGGLQLLALIMGLVLSRNLGKAVDGLFKGVRRLSGGDYAARVQPRGQDQVAHLAEAFNAMAADLQQAQAEHGERLRLEEELRVAREVQMRLLPDVGPMAPSLQAVVLPAREVAGDYFDVFKLSDGRLAFLIADVSGKGTSAAFYAAETKGVLAALDKQGLDPREVASRINAIWCASHPRNLFMTLVYGTFDPASGAFRLVRAGHPAPLLARAQGGVERLHPRGLGIGLSEKAFASAMEICEGVLEPGDRLVCYTDGLSEARSPEGELYGEERLAELLKVPCSDPKPLILGAVTEFVQGEAMDDDLTLLILQR